MGVVKTLHHPSFFRWSFRLESSQLDSTLIRNSHWNLSSQASVQYMTWINSWLESFVVTHSALALWFFCLWGQRIHQKHIYLQNIIQSTFHSESTPTTSAHGEIWLKTSSVSSTAWADCLVFVGREMNGSFNVKRLSCVLLAQRTANSSALCQVSHECCERSPA